MMTPAAKKIPVHLYILHWQYRKPTQVGGMRILRCLSEPSFRNSAKCILNFGRRIAVFTKNTVAEKCSRRLFNKNTGLRKVVKTTYGG